MVLFIDAADVFFFSWNFFLMPQPSNMILLHQQSAPQNTCSQTLEATCRVGQYPPYTPAGVYPHTPVYPTYTGVYPQGAGLYGDTNTGLPATEDTMGQQQGTSGAVKCCAFHHNNSRRRCSPKDSEMRNFRGFVVNICGPSRTSDDVCSANKC